MDKSAADAYIYAKVCGMLSKAFYGKKAAKLYSARSLNELYGILFEDEIPAVPEFILAKEIEKKAEDQFISDYIHLLDCYTEPQQIFLTLLQFYDYDNLKEIAGALCMKETGAPELIELGKYSLLDYSQWPDIKGITQNSVLSWYNKVPEIQEQQKLDSLLDFQYLKELWKDVNLMEHSIRQEAVSLVKKEIIFNNIIWALRLKIYYKMDEEDIIPKLFFDDIKAGEKDILAGEAVKLLKRDTGIYDDWKNWKFKSLLNPHEEGVVWEIDPRWIESAAHGVIMNNYAVAFHKYPVSSLALVCFFKLKQNELDNIRRATEGLRLGGE